MTISADLERLIDETEEDTEELIHSCVSGCPECGCKSSIPFTLRGDMVTFETPPKSTDHFYSPVTT